MKGLIKTIALVGALATLGACSSMTTIAERDEYAQPKWYAKCAQAGAKAGYGGRKTMYMLAVQDKVCINRRLKSRCMQLL